MSREGPDPVDAAVRWYYDESPEETRLQRGVHKLEALRTREIVSRFAPPPPAVVIDVGGGSGPYAHWLAGRGYTVHLVDATPRLVDLARRASAEGGPALASVEVGDARDLGFADGSVDCVLLLGPLYHLTSAGDRSRALAEAARVLKAGGVLIAACITRWASILDGLAHDYLVDPRFVSMMEADVDTGQHRNHTGDVGYFTTAYFHTPAEFEAELRSTGLRLQGVYGLEGPAGLLGDFDERWGDPRRQADLIRVARALESVPSLLGLSAHLLGVARRGDGSS